MVSAPSPQPSKHTERINSRSIAKIKALQIPIVGFSISRLRSQMFNCLAPMPRCKHPHVKADGTPHTPAKRRAIVKSIAGSFQRSNFTYLY